MNTPNPDNNSAQPENNFSMARADTQFKEPMVFLNKERTITSTLLRLKVGDLAAAQSKAQAVGQEIGAQSKVFAVQSSGEGQRAIIRFVVPRAKASDFIAQLASSGSVLERQDENQNITQRFTETLEQYRALVAQLNESQNQQQKTQLNEQIKSLEQQLLAWDEEADDQIIMLSLET
jgi:gas vesicle protein